MPNVLLTPHIGWKIDAVLHDWVAMAAEQLGQYLQGHLDPQIVMNPEALRIKRNRLGNVAK